MSELNLIPQNLKRKNSFFSNTRNRVICISVIAALLLILIGSPIITLSIINFRERKLREEIKLGEKILKESEEIKKGISDYKIHIAAVDAIIKLLPDTGEKIRGLEKYVVGNITFGSLTWENKAITIQAKSNNYDSLCVFVANLQESKEYSDARISQINHDSTGDGYTCSISIKY